MAIGVFGPFLFAGMGLGLLSQLIGIAGPLMLFTLWTLFAGMFKQQVLIRAMRRLADAGLVSFAARNSVFYLSIATGVCSIALPLLAFGPSSINPQGLGVWGWYAAAFFSVGTLITQTASFMVADKAAKRIVTSELAKLASTLA